MKSIRLKPQLLAIKTLFQFGISEGKLRQLKVRLLSGALQVQTCIVKEQALVTGVRKLCQSTSPIIIVE